MLPATTDPVLGALAAGPRTAFEIVEAVGESAPGMFEGREGLVFPLLLDLRRRGVVTSEWVDAGAGRRNLYRLAAEPDAVVPREPPAPPGPRSELLDDAAHHATSRLAFAPRLREEFRTDVLHFLGDGAAMRTLHGEPREEAERRAVRALGDPWKIGVDLARTAQGKRTVIFSRGLGDSLAGIAIYDLRVLLVIVAVIVFVRVQVITAYHIPTKSMEPTLHGDPRRGDRILVNKLAGAPERFDITVFDGFDTDRKNFVKRCTALPGEKLSLFEGDLWIDGRLVRKEGDAYEALLFETFDRERERERASAPPKGDAAPLAAELRFRARMQELWRFDGAGECGVQSDETAPFAGFRISATEGADGPAPRITWHQLVEDSYVDPDTGDPRSGIYNVPDQRITFSVKPVPGTQAHVVVAIARSDDHEYTAVLSDGKGGGVSIAADGAEVARDDSVVLPEGVPTVVSFSMVDYVLRLTVGGDLVLRHDLAAPQDPKRYAPSGASSVRVLRGAAWIDPIRLERDVYYVPDGPEENFARLGPDQFFMMGDNSSNSSDSRAHGPVHRSRLVGSPLLVVWPPSRIHVPR